MRTNASAGINTSNNAIPFTLVFDCEGYSPDLFARLKEQRIAFLSYHKVPGADWSADEFAAQQVTLQNGEVVTQPFIDTIKLIAYRAESALVQIAREQLTLPHGAHPCASLRGSLSAGCLVPLRAVRGVMQSTINLRPDLKRGELRIELHGQTTPLHDRYMTLRSSSIQADQDV